MQPVIDSIGFDAALALVVRFKGTRVWLPIGPDGRDKVSLAIGDRLARKLASDLGHGTFDVPLCQNWMMARRNEEIALRAAFGESRAELARRFGITERHVYRIVRAASITEGHTA